MIARRLGAMAHRRRQGRLERLVPLARRALELVAGGRPPRDAVPVRHPRLLPAGAILVVVVLAAMAVAGSGGHGASALAALSGGSTSGAWTTTPAGTGAGPGAAAATGIPDPLAGATELDPVGLVGKALLVVALLYVTLRVLRHLQGGPVAGQHRLQVLETRPLGPKASLNLVAVGERRIVVGLTPAGMVALAELDASELPEPLPGGADGSPAGHAPVAGPAEAAR